MEFRAITHGSPEYEAECALRHRVLRVPLGLSTYDEDLDAECDDLHFGMFDGDELVACAVLTDQHDGRMQIRQFAVDTDRQRRGAGSALVRAIEAEMRRSDYQTIILHSRKMAVAFYERLGYRVEGDEFIEVTIPHILMTREI